jgi:hypothetical protein
VPVLTRIAAAGLPIGIVTNCSRRLGLIAARTVGISLAQVVTAEDAGWYKPDPRPYQLALEHLGVAADRCLFVAGSAYDLIGTVRVGMPTSWHDRIGMTAPAEAPPPLAHESDLARLPGLYQPALTLTLRGSESVGVPIRCSGGGSLGSPRIPTAPFGNASASTACDGSRRGTCTPPASRRSRRVPGCNR